MTISEAEFEATEERMRKVMEASPRSLAARYDPVEKRLVVTLQSEAELSVLSETVEELADALPDDQGQIEITPTGMGLHWPKLDADVYLPTLVLGILGSEK